MPNLLVMDGELTVCAEPVAAAAEVAPVAELSRTARIEHINMLAAQVAVAEARALEAGQQAWQLGLQLGHALCALKAELPHGEFKKLFKKGSKSDTCVTFGMHYRMAARYMQLYKEAEKWCKRKSLSMCGGALPAEAEVPRELSMRGAMQLFLTDAEGNDLRPAPKFTAPNTAGRVRKGGEEVSEQERVEALNQSADAEFWALLHRVEEFFSSGRHTRVNATTRQAAEAAFRGALSRLMEVK